MRRLFFESYSAVAADSAARVGRTESDAPRKLEKPERDTRLKVIQDRLTGLRLESQPNVMPSAEPASFERRSCLKAGVDMVKE